MQREALRLSAKESDRKLFQSLSLAKMVEISGLEPKLAEPKSVVLPLHHISIPDCKDIKNLLNFAVNTKNICK